MGRIKLPSGGSGNGQNIFLKQPTSAQITLKNNKNQDAKVKQGEFIYLNHPSELHLTTPVTIDKNTPSILVNSGTMRVTPVNNTYGKKVVINSKGYIFIVLVDETQTPNWKTLLYKSTDNGNTWDSIVVYNTTLQYNAQIAIDGNDRIMILMSNQYSAQQGIRSLVSSNDFVTWSESNIFYDSTNYDCTGRIALTVDPVTNVFHIGYSQYFYDGSAYRNYGYHAKFVTSWSTPVRITSLSLTPSVFVFAYNDTVVVGSTAATQANRSTNGGTSFSLISFATLEFYQYKADYVMIPPSVATKINASYTNGIMAITCVGRDNAQAVDQVRIIYSTDLGATWSIYKITTDATIKDISTITYDNDGNVYIYFSNSTNTVFRTKMVTLTSWSAPTSIATNSSYPNAAVSPPSIANIDPIVIFYTSNIPAVQYIGKWNKMAQYIDQQINLADTRNILTTGYTYYTNQGDTDGGRLLTRLSNGWLIAALFNSNTNILEFYCSKDHGQTWSMMTFFTSNTLSGISIASYGTNVYVFVIDSSNTDGMWFFKFDATTVTNTNRYGTHVVVSTGTNKIASGTGWSSIMVGPTGNIHIAYSIKDVTYSDNFNIRYAVSTNGGTSFTVSQVTKLSDNVNNYQQPVMLVTSADVPLILGMQYNTSGTYSIYMLKQTGLTSGGTFFNWTYSLIYSASQLQYNVSGIIDSANIVHVAWRGMDATEALQHIRYCKSTSTTYAAWTTMEKLTSGPYSSGAPSIVVDASDIVYIMASMRPSVNDSFIGLIKKIGSTWSKPEKYDIGLGNTVTCATYKNFTRPLAIWKCASLFKIRFFGDWDTGSTINRDKSKLQAIGDGTLKSYGSIPKHYVGNTMKQEVLF